MIEWTEWRHTIIFWPQRSINNKIIIGWINKRSRDGMRSYNEGLPLRDSRIREFATNKELVIAKLRGRK